MPEVTIKLTVGNFSVEVSGPESYAEKKFEELIERYFSGSRTSVGTDSRQVAQVPTPADHEGKKLSAAEFLRKVNPKNQTDQAMLLGYYLEKMQGSPGFTSTELAAAARETKRSFANPSDIVGKLTSRGLMMSAGDKEGLRTYVVTSSGEEYVESMLEAHQS